MRRSKVFGIGLARTGTTSLCQALRMLGYSAIKFPLGLVGVEEHDAATDIPIADSFEFLDRKYPGSKFIYTVRPRSDWIRSCEAHWARHIDSGRLTNPETAKLLKRLYGTIEFDPSLFTEAYERHEKRVFDYFSWRPDDILTIDICSERSDWGSICSFLERKIPNQPFPHANKTKGFLAHHLDRGKRSVKSIKKSVKAKFRHA